MTQIVFISEISDIEKIPSSILEDPTSKLYSFDIEVHQYFQSKNIKHEIADDLLNHDERIKLFYKLLDFRLWYSNISSNTIQFEGVNLLKLFDTHEFSTYLMPILVNISIIKKILIKENPSKIISTTILEKAVRCVISDQNIQTEFFENNLQKNLLWDKITIKYNLGKKPISINISKNKYLKLKKFGETTAGLFYDFWLDLDKKRKSILLLEFNPEHFSNLLEHLKNYDGNIILVNRRRSAIWSKNALNIVKKSNCKVVNLENILTQSQQESLPLLGDEYLNKFKIFWKDEEFFKNLFKIDDLTFWNVIKEDLEKIYETKLPNFIKLILAVKTLFQKQDICCIVSLNNVGETEKAFLEYGKNTPSILLEHGYIDRVKETKRFDELDYVHFKDKLAVWETYRKHWLCDEFDIEPSKVIITGSPRHDAYFRSRQKNDFKNEKTILLAPNPIGDISGLSSTQLKLKINYVLTKIHSFANKFENVKIIIKLHPIQLKHNEELKSFFKNLDSDLPIFLSTSVIDTINKADLVIVLSPEIYGTSTMLLESMILGKPTMNIVFNKNICQFNHVLKNAVFTISDDYDLEIELKKFFFDIDLQKNLTKNAELFIDEFMANPGNASESFSKILKSY